MLRRLLDPDPPVTGGGIPDANGGGQELGAEDQTGAQITIKSGVLEQRLERERQKARRDYEDSLRSAGRLLSEDEAQNLQEQKRKQAEEEASKQRKMVSEDVLQRLNSEKLEFERKAKEREAELLGRVAERTIKGELSLALASHKYREGVLASHVQQLINEPGRFEVEEDIVYVLDDKKQPLYGDDGKPLTIADYVAKRLTADLAYMVAPEGKAGTGGSTLRGGSQVRLPDNIDNPTVWQSLTPEQKEEAARRQGFRNTTTGGITFERQRKTE